MKTTSTLIGTALLLAAGIGGTTLAAERIRLKPVDGKAVAEETKRPQILSTSQVTPEPLKVPEMKEPGVTRELNLLEEDFNNVPDGQTETIEGIGERQVEFIASHNFEPGRYIDTDYTPNSGTWEGDWAYAGKNGTVVLQSYNPFISACINSPLGEYAGDLTVKVRARFAKTFWGADTETGYSTTPGSSFGVGIFVGGYDAHSIPVTDAPNGSLSSGQIYEEDGWIDFTFTFRNEGANKDGFLSIYSNDAIEIDYVKVTDAATFLASPVVREPSNFTDDGFTISWDPVRRSFNYYVDLWKVNYTADKGIDENYDFENGSIPEGVTADGEVEDGIGVNGTKGFRFGSNGVDAAFLTPEFPGTIGSMTFSAYFDLPDGHTNEDYDPEWFLGTLLVDGLTDDGWQPLAQVVCDAFYVGYGYYMNYILEGERFADRFKAIRFYPEGFKEGNSLILDNVTLWGERPFELVRADGSIVYVPDDDDYAYNYYGNTEHGDPCRYTFTGLDPETEYWYRVRSHNVHDFTIGEKHHAFGVAAPQLLKPTAIGNGSYTANWTDAPKAQNFLVRNFEITKIAANEEGYELLSDKFSKCSGGTGLDSMVPVNNSSEGYLDEYTDMAGWTGCNNSVGEGLLGCYDYTGRLYSPVLPVNPARGEYQVYVELFGTYGDTFCIDFQECGLYSYIPVPEDGYINGYLTIPDVREGEKVRFYSYNNMPFAVGAFEVTQDVEEGDLVRTFASEATVAAGTGSYTFTGLGEGQMFAYQPVSQYKLEKDVVYSTSGDYMVVDMVNGNSFITDKAEIAADAVEVARFNTSGVRVGDDYKGLVIIMMSDGSVRKEIVR